MKPTNLYFDPTTGVILLQLDKSGVGLGDHPIQFNGKTFQPKDEVHITLVGADLGQRLQRVMQSDPTLREQIEKALQQAPWSYQLQDQYFHVVKGEAESIIRLAQVEGIQAFFEQLRSLASVQAEVPPTHVTLYTYSEPMGIGIATQQEWEQLVQGEVSPDELK